MGAKLQIKTQINIVYLLKKPKKEAATLSNYGFLFN